MKKHEKDLTKFCLPLLPCRLRRRLFAIIAFTCLCIVALTAQAPCEPEAQFTVAINGTNLIATAAMPNSSAVFTWTWSDAYGNTGIASGTTLNIPITFSQDNTFNVNLNVTDDFTNASCTHLVSWTESCTRVGFTTDTTGCSATFSPIPPYDLTFPNHYWVFGDGSTSTETYPSHTYTQNGTYNVCHVAWDNPIVGEFIIRYCCEELTIACPIGGGDGNGETIPTNECCRLQICFTHPVQDPNADYYWDFGDGKTSTEMNPCHYYDNVSTYPFAMGGTPTVTVQRCYTPQGGSQTCQDLTVSLVSSMQPAAIYVGTPGQTTSIEAVSSINGLPLFPGNTMQGPYHGPNGTVPKEVHIMGELSFIKDFTFKNQVDFCMDPCAGMVVQHHRKLKLYDNINIRNKCCLWRSIDLDYSAKFTSSNDISIRGAQYGIRTKQQLVQLDISETHFDSNWVGIFLRHPVTFSRFDNNTFISDYTDPHCTPLPNIPPPSCDNEVQVMAQVPHIQRGLAGIVGKNTILNLPVGNTGSNNDFTYMDNGIWLHDSDAEIRRCNFFQIKDLAYGQKSGNAIRSNINNGSHSLKQWGNGTSITETTTGIRMYADSYGNTLQSWHNNMSVEKYGYRLEISGTLAQGSAITSNTIATERHGVNVTMNNAENVPSHLNVNLNIINVNNGTNEGIGILFNDAVPPLAATTTHDMHILENGVTLNNGRAGIETSNFRNADVAFNMVHVNDTGGGNVDPFPPMGIYLDGGKSNIIRCNTVIGTYPGGAQHSIVTEKSYDNLISGNGLSSTAIGFDFRNFCGTTTDLTCNTMQNHLAGLRYWEDGRTGDQFNKGNQWLGTWPLGTKGAWHMSQDQSVILDSEYKAKIGTNQWPPSIDVIPTPPTPWFSNGNFVTCNTGCDVMLQPDSTNELDLAITSYTLGVPANNGVYNWDARRYLYGKLSANAGLANQSTAYSSFLNNQCTTSVGLLYNSSAQILGLSKLPLSISQVLDTSLNAVKAALACISNLDSCFASGSLTETQQASLLADKEAELSNLANLQASIAQIMTQIVADRTTAATSIISTNGSISVTEQYELNEKTLLDLYLKTEAQNLPTALVQKAQILSIANQCPESGGYSTYWARAWYYDMTGILVKPAGCLYAEERSSEGSGIEQPAAQAEDTFTLTPNPAQEFVMVHLGTGSNWEGATLTLLDANGAVRMTEMIEKEMKEIKLPTASLANGLYWVSIKTKEVAPKVKTLVILK